jgi:hypothetical protein
MICDICRCTKCGYMGQVKIAMPIAIKKKIADLREEIKELKWENKDMSIEIKELQREVRKSKKLENKTDLYYSPSLLNSIFFGIKEIPYLRSSRLNHT